ncbi:MAG: DUF927 domain-containing protein [Peptococcaceae bacterium]
MQTNTALCSKQSNPSPTDCQSQSDTILLDYARKGGSFGDTQFTTIGSIADNLARQQLLTQLRDIFRQQKRLTQFNQTFDQWIRQQNQHITHIADSNTTAFTDGPLVLRCGDWTADDSGVYRQQLQKDGTLHRQTACTHPILPIKRLINKQTGEEKLQLAFYRDTAWRTITVPCTLCYDSKQIVQLARHGILISSENARHLVAYLHQTVSLSQQDWPDSQALPWVHTTCQLGWHENRFFPYTTALQCDTEPEFQQLYQQFHTKGHWHQWFDLVEQLRQSQHHVILRMTMAASLSSVLLEPLGALPYVYHLWGRSGFGKTLSLMLAQSIWGNPANGALVRTLNMTNNAMARTAAFLHHLPFAADELQQVEQQWTDTNALIMQLTEGMDRSRAKARGGIEALTTWRNTFLFTGEQPITNQRSGDGVRNRVLEVEATGKLFDDGLAAANILRHNYGWAGPEFVAYVQTQPLPQLQQRFAQLQQQLSAACNTSDKQAASMAALLLADELACGCIFSGQTPLTIAEVQPYLRRNEEIDSARQAYQFCCDLIARSSNRFRRDQNGEIWGKIAEDGSHVMINKSVLADQLERHGYNYTATIHRWAELELVERNSQGRLTHSRNIFGIKANFIKLYLSVESVEDYDPTAELQKIS